MYKYLTDHLDSSLVKDVNYHLHKCSLILCLVRDSPHIEEYCTSAGDAINTGMVGQCSGILRQLFTTVIWIAWTPISVETGDGWFGSGQQYASIFFAVPVCKVIIACLYVQIFETSLWWVLLEKVDCLRKQVYLIVTANVLDCNRIEVRMDGKRGRGEEIEVNWCTLNCCE